MSVNDSNHMPLPLCLGLDNCAHALANSGYQADLLSGGAGHGYEASTTGILLNLLVLPTNSGCGIACIVSGNWRQREGLGGSDV